MILRRYFDRIGFEGPQRRTIDALRDLHLRHAQSIAFENLSAYLGLGVSLAPEALFAKMIEGRRGGYCYEQNSLFRSILDALGFRTRGLAARVRYNVPEHRVTGRTHMLILVDVDGEPYVADVGFGGMTMTAPLRLETSVEQPTPHGPYRLSKQGGDYVMSARIGDEWRTLYVFDLTEQAAADYEVMNWYTATHPNSKFVTNVIASRPVPGGRHSLLNGRYSYYGLDGEKREQVLQRPHELRELLADVFDVVVPRVPHVDERFAQALERADESFRSSPKPQS